ncbi:MAG: para-nitrobenzyl esterase [Candidatus Binatia bacterium]|nr:MAG: para-nitrobenzyl esterase [Candidatus Binatia bacterium]
MYARAGHEPQPGRKLRPPWFLAGVASVLVALCACHREPQKGLDADPVTLRRAPAGPVIGGHDSYGSYAWYGIPYAAPPVGPLRWRKPQPLPAWTQPREATRRGAPCMQFPSPFGGVAGKRGAPTGSEDCLVLDIWTPPLSAAEIDGGVRLPVMVWIHGGGNTIGSTQMYHGGHLATAQRVVVVAVQYRLGPFGWFRHPALRATAADAVEASGNYGTLDLVAALHWVRENISAFGGEPANVTIFGESAGGTNVFSLLLSPLARGLYHRAIVQSGGMRFSEPEQGESASDRHGSIAVTLRWLERAGGAREPARMELDRLAPAELAQQLRSIPAGELLSLYEPGPAGMIRMPLLFRDGSVLPSEEPMTLLAQGRYHKVPVILGTNRDEMKLFFSQLPQLVRYRLWLFPRIRDERLYALYSDYASRMWKATGADEPAERMSAVQGPTVFVYRFDWDELPRRLGIDLGQLLGAAHGFEIPFVFGHFDLGRASRLLFSKENEPGRMALSRAMMSYWSEFAANGNPARGRQSDLPLWLPWDPSDPAAPKYIVFDTERDGGIRMANAVVRRADVLANIARDERFRSPEERCALYRLLAEFGRGLTAEEYRARGCDDTASTHGGS